MARVGLQPHWGGGVGRGTIWSRIVRVWLGLIWLTACSCIHCCELSVSAKGRITYYYYFRKFSLSKYMMPGVRYRANIPWSWSVPGIYMGTLFVPSLIATCRGTESYYKGSNLSLLVQRHAFGFNTEEESAVSQQYIRRLKGQILRRICCSWLSRSLCNQHMWCHAYMYFTIITFFHIL